MGVHQSEPYGYLVNGTVEHCERTFTVSDPATNEPLAAVADPGATGVERAVAAANDAQGEWADLDAATRSSMLREVAAEIRERAEDIAAIETAECGRPFEESMAHPHVAAGYFEYYAGLTDKIEGETLPVPGERLNYSLREPLGVLGMILPWNGPVMLGARSLPVALACGNTVVMKPAAEAPTSLLELGRIANEVLPDGVVNVVPGGGETGAALSGSPDVDRVMFTGSRETGTAVMQSAAENIVPVGLELGGKNPSLVFPDADLDRVVDDMMNVYFNAGQVCFAPVRLFLHEDVYDEVLEELVARTEAMTVGPGGENPDMGPLITREARDRVAEYVDDAVADGARLRAGGEIPREEGNFYAPTILEGVDDDAPIACDEIFGPVLLVFGFSETGEAVRRANDSDYGLGAVVFTNDLSRAHRVASDLEVGTVSVNEYPGSFVQAASGPYKQSGIGREKGQEAIEDYTNLKSVNVLLEESDGPF